MGKTDPSPNGISPCRKGDKGCVGKVVNGVRLDGKTKGCCAPCSEILKTHWHDRYRKKAKLLLHLTNLAEKEAKKRGWIGTGGNYIEKNVPFDINKRVQASMSGIEPPVGPGADEDELRRRREKAERLKRIRRMRSRRRKGFGIDTSTDRFKAERKKPEPREKTLNRLIDMIVNQGELGLYLEFFEGEPIVDILDPKPVKTVVENRLTWAHTQVHASDGGGFEPENAAVWCEVLNASVSDRVDEDGNISEECVREIANILRNRLRPATEDEIRAFGQEETDRLLSQMRKR